MKTLLLMRHAKSSWDEADVSDHDRPLSTRGEKSAPQMAAVLVGAKQEPELIVSSTALRARATAFAVAEAFEWRPELRLRRALYLAEAHALLQLASEMPDSVERLMLVGHNPGMEELVGDLSFMRQAMPTAAIAWFSFPVSRWTELPSARGTLEHVWRPKEID